jgi:magnesium transporter
VDGTERFIYLSEIVGCRVVLERTRAPVGTVADISTPMKLVYPKISGLLVRRRGDRRRWYLPWDEVLGISPCREIVVRREPFPLDSASSTIPEEVLLKETFWDQQIVDVSGSKVVRINDLHLLRDGSTLYLVHIDIGSKGFLRRLGWLPAFSSLSRFLFGTPLADHLISWKNVQPVSTTSIMGTVSLRVPTRKLEDVLPADLADIMVDLGSEDRSLLFRSLDTEAAAQTLHEMPLKARVALAEGLPAPRLAELLARMPQDEVAQLFRNLEPARVHELFDLLPPADAAEVRELLSHGRGVAGSLMNTDFVAVKGTNLVSTVLARLRTEYAEAESIYYVYVTDEEGRLTGELTLRDLLTAKRTQPIFTIMSDNVIKVSVGDDIDSVATVFTKYNFTVVPVVDVDDRLVGTITIKDALEAAFPEIRAQREETS